MFEFSDKEIRAKFNKTEYGKKLGKMLCVAILAAFVLFVASCILYFTIAFENPLLTDIESLWLNILFGMTTISVILACYFDGKRDGAIEQFKRDNKK